MDEKLKKRWVKALRSGKYVQGRRYLVYERDVDAFCCLGVLCEIQDPSRSWEGDIAPPTELAAGLDCEDVSILINANDVAAWTFEEIADYIEVML